MLKMIIKSKTSAAINVQFVKVDKNEVCADTSKPSVMKKPSIASEKTKRKRFRPKVHQKSLAESVLEFITDPYSKTLLDAREGCFRLNGELLALPQNEEEEELLDKILWDFQLKRYSNNLTRVNEDAVATMTFVAAETKQLNKESQEIDPRKQTFAPNGVLDLVHPFTGAKLIGYREGYLLPQMMTYYKSPKLCVSCFSSMKKPKQGRPWRDHKEPLCLDEKCAAQRARSYTCVFPEEPTFTIRGLCKDAVMDTQYKFADHIPGSAEPGEYDCRSYVGPKGWVISRNKTDKKWRMSHYYYTDLTLTMLDSDSLPVGRHKWLIENNVCNEGETSAQELQLSGCQEGQFTCDDGKCLDIFQRCNNIEANSL